MTSSIIHDFLHMTHVDFIIHCHNNFQLLIVDLMQLDHHHYYHHQHLAAITHVHGWYFMLMAIYHDLCEHITLPTIISSLTSSLI